MALGGGEKERFGFEVEFLKRVNHFNNHVQFKLVKIFVVFLKQMFVECPD